MRVLASKLLNQINDLGTPRHAPDQNQVVDVANTKAGILEALFEGSFGSSVELIANLFQFRSGQGDVEVLRTVLVGRDERQVDFSRLRRGKRHFGLLGLLLEPLHGHRIGRKVDSLLRLEFPNQPVDDLLVPVVSTELGVPVSRPDGENSIRDF